MSDLPEKRRNAPLTKEEREILIKNVAARAALGASINAMAQEFGKDRTTIDRIMRLPETKDAIKNIVDSATVQARSELKARVANIKDLMFERLVFLLKSDAAREVGEGLKIAMRIVGFDKQEEAAGSGTLIIQMPGSSDRIEKAVEIEGYEVDPNRSGAV